MTHWFCLYGKVGLEETGKHEKRKYYAGARMWVSARLLQINSSAADTEQINPLCDFLKPHFNYDIVLASLKYVFTVIIDIENVF